MKKLALRRLLAYTIDIIIISVLMSLICIPIAKSDNQSLTELKTLETELINDEITPSSYLKASQNILYSNHKDNHIEITINFLLLIGYFIVFQYTNNGKTIGKMLLKIKVVNKGTTKSPTILKGLVRSIIMFNIVSSFINVALINILNKNIYIITYLITIEIENILAIICILFILFKKDGRGLHDIISNTEVIEER